MIRRHCPGHHDALRPDGLRSFTSYERDLGCFVVTFVSRTTGNALSSHILDTRVRDKALAWAEAMSNAHETYALGIVDNAAPQGARP